MASWLTRGFELIKSKASDSQVKYCISENITIMIPKYWDRQGWAKRLDPDQNAAYDQGLTCSSFKEHQNAVI